MKHSIHTYCANGKIGKDASENIRSLLLSLEGDITITIEKTKKKRSNNQNRYYWSVCVDLISEHTGYTPEEIHDLLKLKFLGAREVEIGGKKEVIINSTTKLSTVEFNNYLEQLKIWAAELNIVLPDPNQG